MMAGSDLKRRHEEAEHEIPERAKTCRVQSSEAFWGHLASG